MAKALKNLCIISDGYPTDAWPKNAFVKQLVKSISDLGVSCTVISPQSLTRILLGTYAKQPYKVVEYSPGGNPITIYRPLYISVSDKVKFGIKLLKISAPTFSMAAKRTFSSENLKSDAVYGHFFFPCGYAACRISEKFNIPYFAAAGECSYDFLDNYTTEEFAYIFRNISGVVSVSTANKDELVNKKMIPDERIGVFINAIDNNLFHRRDRDEMRKKLGFPKDDFIVAFVGYFINRKGSRRVSQALSRLPGVKSIFIGSGEEPPACNGILHMGYLPHEQIPEHLCAADIFVLPTLAEGCCNAIIEAMACGLPVISSDLDFNDDILTYENSIRIDPNDIDAITESIKRLRDDKPLRRRLSEKSLETAANLTLASRCAKIKSYIEANLTDTD